MSDDAPELDIGRMMQGMAAAERANARDKEHAAFVQALFLELMEITDSVEELEAHCQELAAAGAETPVRSIGILRRRLTEALADREVEPIPAVGAALDLTLHEVVAVASSEDVAGDTVIEERRRGYRLQRKVLRKAQVVVAG